MAEQYFNLFSTTVAVGGYTAGSGVLNVAATSPISLAASDTTRLLVYRVVAGTITPIVLLKATAVNSSTQFAVTAEGSDTNALATDVVINVNSVGGENQIRADTGRILSGALPSDGRTGDQMNASDDNVMWVNNGSVFKPFGPVFPLTNPLLSTFSWVNQGSASLTSRAGSLYVANASLLVDINYRLETAPATPYTRTALLIPQFGADSDVYGLFFRQSSSGKIHQCGFKSNATKALPSFGVFDYSAPTTFNATRVDPANANLGFVPFGYIWLRIGDDGTNLKFSFSQNGLDFIQIASWSRTAYMTSTGPDGVGFFISGGATAVSLGLGLTVLSYG